MADKSASNSKIGTDTKKKKLKVSCKVPADDALLSDEKSAVIKEKDSLNYEKGLEPSFKKPNEIKYETDILNEMLDSVVNKSSPLSIKALKKVSASPSTPASITIKKEIITNGKVGGKPLAKVPAYKPTPTKPVKALNVQTGEANSDKSGNQALTDENKKEGNIIPLTAKELSDEERKKLRAKRFNIIVAESSQNDEKAILKTVPNHVYDKTSILANNPTPTFNTLKKRAERFGENVSSVMKSLDHKEKLLKRKLKFLESVTNLKELEIKKKRAERFRMP